MIIAERILLFICILIGVYMTYQVGYMNGFGNGIDIAREILDMTLRNWEDNDGEEEET